MRRRARGDRPVGRGPPPRRRAVLARADAAPGVTSCPVTVVPAPARRPWLRWVGGLAGAGLGGVLLFAAATKAVDPALFAEGVRAEGLDLLLPAGTVAILAIALEVGLGTALLLGLRRPTVLVATSALVVFFLFLTGRAYAAHLAGATPDPASCGCFGRFVERSPAQAFWQDVALLVPTAALAWVARPRGGPTPWRRATAAAGLAVGGAAFALAAPSLPLDDLATRLAAGDRMATTCVGEGKRVCLRDVLPLTTEGRHVVVLADLDDPALGAAVPELNGFALDVAATRLWVLTAADKDAVARFALLSGATFPVVSGPASLLRPLYRRLPRAFLVVDGVVRETWDGMPPLAALSAPPG